MIPTAYAVGYYLPPLPGLTRLTFMFAVGFIVEPGHEYRTLDDLPLMLLSWVNLTGGLAMIVLLIWALICLLRLALGHGPRVFYGLSGRLAGLDESQVWKPRSFWLLLVLTVLCLPLSLALRGTSPVLAGILSLIAYLSAILAVSWEFLLSLLDLSPRRIWALSRFSMKEAIRRKALWTFCLIIVVFLFASWFIEPEKEQDRWRLYVNLVFFVMQWLLLFTAAVLACFSLPTDIRQQTIHTVVTKPVQRFELILGRILGFTILMTVVLLVMAHLSLLYVFRGIEPEARDTCMRARVPVFARPGMLNFEELSAQGWGPTTIKDPSQGEVYRDPTKGENVGREWEYRQYIAGGVFQRAVWRFRKDDLPRDIDPQERIPVEFTFDIFRTSKGTEDTREGVNCQIYFVNTSRWDEGKRPLYLMGIDPDPKVPSEARGKLSDEEKALKYGYYELPQAINVVDYKTETVWFPAGVLQGLGDNREYPFEIRVECRNPGQYLGMARHDLYVVKDEASFYVNFLKGTMGIWFLMVLVVTLGVVFSTYLSALVAFMATQVLMGLGSAKVIQFITDLAMYVDPTLNQGPGEATFRLLRDEKLTTPLEQTATVTFLQYFDTGWRYLMWGLLNVLPDLEKYDRTIFVAEGFSIPGAELFVNLLQLLGYLFPFLLAGFYLLNAREVAN